MIVKLWERAFVNRPVLHRGSRYNCRVFLWNGRILLIRPKMYMADEGNYCESRWFNCWERAGHFEEHPLPFFMHGVQRTAPFGDAILDCDDTSIAAEICEELFAPMSPHLSLALAGNVEIFVNGSASHHELGKLRRRFNLILGATSKVDDGGGGRQWTAYNLCICVCGWMDVVHVTWLRAQCTHC